MFKVKYIIFSSEYDFKFILNEEMTFNLEYDLGKWQLLDPKTEEVIAVCDNNVVDHQVVNMQLEDGATIGFTMCAFTKNGFRKLRIMGTLGEIEGDMETNRIYLKPFAGEVTEIDVYTLSNDFSGHGGGDVQMLREVVALIKKGETAGSSITTIEQSMQSHYVAFAAEASRVNNGKIVDMTAFLNENN